MRIQGGAARLALLAAGVAGVADEAVAGAWSHEKGAGQQIATFSSEHSDFGSGWRSDLLLEGGLGGGWDLSLKAQTLLWTDPVHDERSTYEAGVRKSFAIGSRSVAAVQGTILAGESLTVRSCEGTGYEARAAYGVSASIAERPVFLDVEGAYRQRGPDCRRTLFEVSAGVEMTKRVRTISKFWSEHGDGTPSAKAEALMLYDVGDYSLGLGYRREISGRFDEEAFLVTFWSEL